MGNNARPQRQLFVRSRGALWPRQRISRPIGRGRVLYSIHAEIPISLVRTVCAVLCVWLSFETRSSSSSFTDPCQYSDKEPLLLEHHSMLVKREPSKARSFATALGCARGRLAWLARSYACPLCVAGHYSLIPFVGFTAVLGLPQWLVSTKRHATCPGHAALLLCDNSNYSTSA